MVDRTRHYARLYIQCWSDRDGRVGSFLFEPSTGIQPSPTCADLVELFAWCRQHGWTNDGTLNGEYSHA